MTVKPPQTHPAVLLIVAAVFLVLSLKPVGAEKILSDEEHTALLGYMENLKMIEEAVPEIELDPIVIYRDKVGRYYLPEKVKLSLDVGYLSYSADVMLPTRIETMPRRVVKLSGKIQGGVGYDLDHGVGLMLGYELMNIWKANLHGYVTPVVIGAGIGWAITNNTSIVGGVGIPWKDVLAADLRERSIIVGLMLGF